MSQITMIQLRYFLAVAEMESFTRAAQACRVSQPSLSLQIQNLEQNIGHSLFERGKKQIALTEAGQQLRPRAEKILKNTDEIEHFFRLGFKEEEGKLTVGIIPTMGPYVLPSVLDQLQLNYPKCKIHVYEDLTENLIKMIKKREIDVAIMSDVPVDTGIESEVLGQEIFVAALTPSLAKKRTSISTQELSKYPFIKLNPIHCMGKQIDEYCQSFPNEHPVEYHSSQLQTIQELIRRNDGVSILPSMCANKDRQEGVAYLDLKPEAPKRIVTAVWKKGTEDLVLRNELMNITRKEIIRVTGQSS